MVNLACPEPATRRSYGRLSLSLVLGAALLPLLSILAGGEARAQNAPVSQPSDFVQARQLADARDYRGAARAWRAIATKHPDDPRAAWSLATALRAAGELEPALDTLIEFTRQHPDTVDVSRECFDAWFKGPLAADDLKPLLDRLGERAASDFAVAVVLGAAAGAAHEYEQAQTWFQKALELRPDFTLVHVVWGWMLLQDDRWSDAQSQARDAMATGPESAAAHYLLAAAHAGLDENDDAEREFLAAIKLAPTDAGYCLALAEHYRRMNNLLATQRYFQQALLLDPTSGAALENVVDSYLAGGKVEIAQEQLEAAEKSGVSEDALRRARTTLRYSATPFDPEHLAELTRQFDAHPQDAETGLKLAAGLYLRDKPDEALPVLKRVLTLLPGEERALWLMARVQAQRLERGAAIDALEELIRRYPNRVDVRALLAENYLDEFRLDEARSALHRVLDGHLTDTARIVYRQRLLATYTEFSQYDDALRLLDEWLAAEPDSPTWAIEKLETLVRADRQSDAVDWAEERLTAATKELEKLVQKFNGVVRQFQATPSDEAVRAEGEALQRTIEQKTTALGDRRKEYFAVCLAGRDFKAAEEHLRGWLGREADENIRAQYTEQLVRVLIADKRSDEALALLDKFRPSTPAAEVAVQGWKARAHVAAGRYDEAIAVLRKLLDDKASVLTPPDRIDVWQQLVGTYVAAGRYDDALTCCDEGLSDGEGDDAPSQTLRLGLRASVLTRAGRTDEYVKAAEQLLELDPNNVGMLNDLGYTWADAGENLPKATQMLRKAVAAQPLRAAYLDSLGWAYYKSGDFDQARKYLGRAARLREGQDEVIFDHLADSEFRLNDTAAAQRDWEKALNLAKESEQSSDEAPLRAELPATIRAKLSALERSERPDVAPTAAEQHDQPK